MNKLSALAIACILTLSSFNNQDPPWYEIQSPAYVAFANWPYAPWPVNVVEVHGMIIKTKGNCALPNRVRITDGSFIYDMPITGFHQLNKNLYSITTPISLIPNVTPGTVVRLNVGNNYSHSNSIKAMFL